MREVLHLLPGRVRGYASTFLGKGASRALMAVSGGAAIWLLLQVFGGSVVRLFSNFIMTRLLEPEAFGLIGIAFAVQSLINLMTDIGLNGSVIRSDRGHDRTFLRTIWVTKIVRSFLIYICVLIFAFWLSLNQANMPDGSLWQMDLLPLYLCVSGLSVIIASFSSPSVLLANRNLDFKRTTVLNVTGAFSQVPVMILAALAGMGPWALLIGALFSNAFKSAGSYVFLQGPRMAFEWDRDCFNEIFRFGKWLLVASVASYLVAEGDRFIFSSLFDARTFSLYVIATLWLNMMVNVVQMLIRKICLPAIARCRRENPELLPSIYKRFRLIADGLSIAFFLVLMLGGDLLFTIFYTAEFEPAQEFLPFVAFAILFCPYILTHQVMLAAGDSRSYAGIQALAAVITFIAVPWAFHAYGPFWAGFVFAINKSVTVPFTLWAASKAMPLDLFTELRVLIFGAAAAAAMVALA